MGRRAREGDHHHHHHNHHYNNPKSQTLPPSPSHSFSSSSSSDFEFTISVSPRKSSTALCRPADELFYKGQLLPLHLSPRLSMVRTLLLASSSTSSSSDTTTTASRDSTGSTTSNESHSSLNSDLVLLAASASESCNSSSRPSSVTEDEEFKRLTTSSGGGANFINAAAHIKKSNKYFSLARFSSVFKKAAAEPKAPREHPDNVSGSSVKRMSATAKDVIRKYLKKVKPLYEKLSQKQQQQERAVQEYHEHQRRQKLGRIMTAPAIKTTSFSSKSTDRSSSSKGADQALSSNNKRSTKDQGGGFSHSFSGNLRYPRRKSCISSCPSSIRSSPSHSGVLCRPGFAGVSGGGGGGGGGMYYYGATSSSMEELQSAIQGAIAHCKNSLVQNKTMVSNEI
ncbi:putative membrane-associated kinase regulator [Parasponia andersonii]|uniref:Putative membrane-associated kinase regulator n=1 Tax=Parasponia andersonii TaxID=3476 RepID=A0A2P5E3L4_PARAD|nr:putative membrane-associated kinase regulator [Parasponia andersonii]